MSAIAIITARGGSKRIPKKNIKDFCGKPIIAYSILAAVESGLFSEVMVSTDSEEIAEIAKQYGAKVPFFRSEKASDDFATTSDVIFEVLTEYEKLGQSFDYVCCIYPTAPFVTGERLKKAQEILVGRAVNSVFPVVQFSYPPQRCLEMDGDTMVFSHPEHAFARSQDLRPLYHDCGQFYFMKTAVFMRHKALVLPKTAPLFTDETQMQDIDTLSDWAIAEMKYRLGNGE